MKKYILIIITSLLGLTHAMADNISVADVAIVQGGTATVSISLNNTETNLVSFQMDLTLPEGISINKAGCSLSNRFTDENQELTIGKQGTNVYRLMSTSFSLTPISGTSGEIITLSLTASDDFEGGTATLGNIRFVTSQSEKILIADTSFNINVGTASPNITFADANVKAICVANWDANGDGELTEAEAAAVTSLGEVFKNNSQITSFDELQHFTGLTEIDDNAFSNCSGLTSIIFPEGITHIGEGALYGCSGLTAITLPSTLTSTGNECFRECTGLTAVHISDLDAYCRISFGWYAPLFYAHHLYLNGEEVTGEVVFPDGVTAVSNVAFEGCTGITSVVIPEGVTSIGVSAFRSCTNLTSISLPSTLQSIWYDAFNSDINLTSVIIPEGVSIIDARAFQGCTGLTSIALPDGITTIKSSTFNGCTHLENVSLPENLASIEDYAFFCCSSLTSITIPESVTEIGWAAFQNCYSLTSVNLPSGITKIEGYLFCGSPLTSIDIPSNVTSIGNLAFHACNFSSVTIPEYVETIGENAFSNCGAVTSITVYAETPPVVANHDAFSNCYNATLYVPLGCKAAYESADYWNEFKEIIEVGTISDLTELSNNGLYTLRGEEGLYLMSLGQGVVLSSVILDANCMGIVSNASQLSSPWTEPTEGSIEALLDNNSDSFWHSNWRSGAVENHTHYLQVDLIEPTGENIRMQVTRRPVQNDHITQWSVYGSNTPEAADSEWELLTTLNTPYHNNTETCLTEAFSTNGYRYLRFYIDNTTTGRGYGHMSEFRLFRESDIANYQAINDENAHFAILNINDKYYLYSPSRKAFYLAQGNFCPGFGTALTLDNSLSDNDYRWGLTMSKNNETVNLGQYVKIERVSDFDPTEALSYFAENANLGFTDGYYRVRSAMNFTNTVSDGQGNETEVHVNKYACGSVDSEGNLYGSWCTPEKSEEECASVWKLTNSNGHYDLQNLFTGGRFTTINSRAMMSEESESLIAIDRITEQDGIKYVAIRVASQAIGDYFYMHAKGHSEGRGVSGDLVGWSCYPNGGASWWILEPVSQEEAESLIACASSCEIGTVFDAPVPCNDGTVDLTFKVTNKRPLQVEVMTSPEDIAGALTIPATVQNEYGIEFAVKAVGNNAFENRKGITSVVIEEGIDLIGGWAFQWDDNIESVTLPDGVYEIWGAAFAGCNKLQSINLPGSVRVIKDYAFRYCSALTSIILPEGLTTIQNNAFQDSGLESIKFPSTLTEVGESAFRDSKLSNIDFSGCSATFGNCAFSGCNSLEYVYIPNTVSINGIQVFNWCLSLKKVEFQEGYAVPANQTFWHCINLEEVILPTTAVFNWTGWFLECPNIKKVTFLDVAEGEGIWQIWDYNQQFDLADPTSCRFIIPEGKAEAFLRKGYMNISDLSGLPLVREEFEAEASRISSMADVFTDGDKTALNEAISVARTIVNAAEDYLTIYNQIAAIKDAAKTFLATATMHENFDVTAAMVTNPDIDRFAIGWNLPMSMTQVGYRTSTYSNGDINLDKFMEVWINGWALDNGKISQTLTNLPAGNYRLECDAIATWQDDASVEVTGVSLFAGNEKTAMATGNRKPQHFSVTFENRMTKDVKIGIDINSTNANWVAMDNVRLYYLGEATPYNIPSHTELVSSETDTLYLYNVEGETFLKAGNSHGWHAILGNEGLPVRLTQDSETGLWQVYFWEGSKDDKLLFREYGYTDEVYVDYNMTHSNADSNLTKWLITESANGTYLIQNKTLEGTDKYVGNVPSRLDCQTAYTGETHTDVIATAARTENIHWLVMTKKQYEDYQRGLIYPNMLYVENTPSIPAGGKTKLEMSLKNDDAVNMTDFYLQLPEGMEIEKISVSADRSDKHQVSAQKNSDGYYHVVCFSSQNNAFKGNDGVLYNIVLSCGKTVTPGNYEAGVKSVLMTGNITQPDFTFGIEVADILMGDANGDGSINGLDIVEMVDHIMHRPSEDFQFIAADLHYDNKINGLDLVELVSLVLEQGYTPGASSAPALNGTSQHAEGMLLLSDRDGLVTLGTESADVFILTQCIVQLTEGMELKEVKADDSHTAVWKQLGEGRYAVVAYSLKNDSFQTNEALLKFVINGKGSIGVSDVMVVDTERQARHLGTSVLDTATGIDEMESMGNGENERSYDLAGRRVTSSHPKGVYIVNGKKMLLK